MITSIPKKLSSFTLIPRNIWALGFVSLFMDASSEMIHSLLPIFLVTTLGASMSAVGLIEGIAESTALIAKVFSGMLSDYFRNRKFLTTLGYGLALFIKPFFPSATSIGLVLTARFVDRIGKGIRGAPRDAMIGDIAPPEIRAACFGLRQAMDTLGAVIGPLLAIIGMLMFANNVRLVLWVAVIPAIISVIILIFGVSEPPIKHSQKKSEKYFNIRNIYKIGNANYWKLIVIAIALSLARFSDAFLILKSQAIGVPLAFVPVVMIMMNVIYALVAYPAGVLADNINKKTVLLIGTAFLIFADVILGFTNNLWMLALGVGFWGLHMAFTQGLLAAMVTDTAQPELRGTAYGMFNFVCGIALLFSSIIAGVLWDWYGPAVTFLTGAIFTTLAFVSLLIFDFRTK